MLLEPLAQRGRRTPLRVFRKPLLVTVNALDECDRDKDPAVVPGLRSLGMMGYKSRLRVLWTSWPMIPICYATQPCCQRVSLASRCTELRRHSLITTLPFSFVTISASSERRSYAAPDRPGATVIDQLVWQAEGLFV